MKSINLWAVALLLLPLGFTGTAQAHQVNNSFIYMQVSDAELSGRFEVHLEDLNKVIELDANSDGAIDQQDLVTLSPDIFQILFDRLDIFLDNQPLEVSPGDVSILNLGVVGDFGQFRFDVEGLEPVPPSVQIYFRTFSEIDPAHTTYVAIEENKRIGIEENETYMSHQFQKGDRAKVLSLIGEPWFSVFVKFVIHGIWHIWLGFDHVLFVVTLLLPAVMMASAGQWIPQEKFRSSAWTVAKIITIFTVSHSVTLTLAGLGAVVIPVWIVEAIIAASIIAVALMNTKPSMHRHMPWVVFIFGLFHGFGFANVLAPLTLSLSRQVLGIAAFNIGVEIGQLAIVTAVFPLLWLVRRWSLYPFLAFRLGTIFLIIVAGIWFLERATSFELNVRAIVFSVTGIEIP